MIATAEFLRRLSPQDFQALGARQLAYIRPVVMDGIEVYSIHAANGALLAIHDDRMAAQALMRENELEPVSIQ